MTSDSGLQASPSSLAACTSEHAMRSGYDVPKITFAGFPIVVFVRKRRHAGPCHTHQERTSPGQFCP